VPQTEFYILYTQCGTVKKLG